MPEMQPVQSSNIKSIGYDEEARELVVEFTSGATYAYSNVDQPTFSDFLGSASKGKYFAAFIKDAYSTRRIA
jgi:KTSC domain-containing protein